MRPLVVAVLLTSITAGCQSDTPTEAIVDHYALTWGPVTVPPASEATQCIWMHLSNATEIKVHQLHNVLGPSSHHLIVYKDDMDATEQLTPVPCQPFTGALNTTGKIFPVMITQKHDDALTLPHGVAYTLAPHQMIKIEMHYLNATDAAVQATATVDFGAADPAAIQDEANILFIGTPDVMLPSNTMTEVHEYFSPGYAGLDLSSARFFAITGHTHKLGLSVEVGTAAAPMGPFTSVYSPASFLWSEPETTTHDPEFTLPDGGGFDFTCRYYNSTSGSVRFGESANDEMCFFWAYYYPSNGAHVCAHTNYHNLDVNLCCPEAGPQLCGLLDTKP
jgi:copper type II ascorbate-dependent monooxygenase-like protein